MRTRWLPALALALLTAAGPVQAQERAGAEATAIFAGGCFWCVEEAFDAVDGVTETTSGYSGGTTPDPTYEQVTAGGTGHYEVVRVRYDPEKVDYRALLDVFWRNIDPFDARGQFCDKGESYRSAIFVASEEERALAEESKEEVAKILRSPMRIATEIKPAATFYAAEDYHQGYYEKNPLRYRYYKWNCGRAQRLEQLWGPPKS